MEQGNEETPKMEGKYKVEDHTLKEWTRKVEEENARWRHLGINLDNLTYAGSEIFALQAKVQALINCMLLDTPTEEALNMHLKMITFETMEKIRESIEPEIQKAKLTAGVQQPRIVMPWEPGFRKEGNGGS